MPYAALPDILIAIRWFIALVFITAAIAKLQHWREFSGVVANYRLLPTPLVKPLAYALPPVEAALSVALLADGRSVVPPLAAMTLLAVFAAAMAINLARGRRDIDCGCFQTHLKQTLRWVLVARNGMMIGLLGVLATAPWPTASLWGGAPIWDTANGLLAGTAAFFILQSFNTLWAIVPTVPRRIVDADTSATRAP